MFVFMIETGPTAALDSKRMINNNDEVIRTPIFHSRSEAGINPGSHLTLSGAKESPLLSSLAWVCADGTDGLTTVGRPWLTAEQMLLISQLAHAILTWQRARDDPRDP
jgi:hypothetical protein